MIYKGSHASAHCYNISQLDSKRWGKWPCGYGDADDTHLSADDVEQVVAHVVGEVAHQGRLHVRQRDLLQKGWSLVLAQFEVRFVDDKGKMKTK